MKKIDTRNKYSRAKAKVDKIRGFYLHFMIYFIICTGITVYKIYRNLNNGETFDYAFYDFSTAAIWLFWGIGIAFHAFGVFGLDYILGKNWEERKIKQYMEEEENSKI